MCEAKLIRKWVRVDDSGRLSEIDLVRLRREATVLSELLLSLNDDPYDLAGCCTPFLRGVMEGDLQLLVERAPLAITRMEDAGVVLPEGFIDAYCAFFMTAQGYRFDFDKIEPGDGDDGAGVWVDFEVERDGPG